MDLVSNSCLQDGNKKPTCDMDEFKVVCYMTSVIFYTVIYVRDLANIISSIFCLKVFLQLGPSTEHEL